MTFWLCVTGEGRVDIIIRTQVFQKIGYSSLRIKAKLSLEKETPNAFFISWKKGRRLQSVKKESSTSLGLQLSFSRERRVAEAFLEEVVFWLWSVTSYALRYYYRSSTVGKLLLVQDMHSTPSRGHQSFRKHSRRGGISANQRLSFSSSFQQQ